MNILQLGLPHLKEKIWARTLDRTGEEAFFCVTDTHGPNEAAEDEGFHTRDAIACKEGRFVVVVDHLVCEGGESVCRWSRVGEEEVVWSRFLLR